MSHCPVWSVESMAPGGRCGVEEHKPCTAPGQKLPQTPAQPRGYPARKQLHREGAGRPGGHQADHGQQRALGAWATGAGRGPCLCPCPCPCPASVCVCVHAHVCVCMCAWIFSCSMLNYRNPNEVHKKIYSISDMFCMCVTMMEIVSSLNYHEVHKCVNET